MSKISGFKCFLDLDDVLVDFIGWAHRVCGVDYHADRYPYEIGVHTYIGDMLGMESPSHLWQQLDRQFWAELPWMESGKEILRIVEQFFGPENICILTAPNENPSSASGKIEWIQRELPEYAERFLIGNPKHFCSHKRAVLIDDNQRNAAEFVAAGGAAIIVPRPWNNPGGYISGDSDIEYVEAALYLISMTEMMDPTPPAKPYGYVKKRKCKVCGCTDDDCRQCIEAQGFACYWVEPDLCSRCESEAVSK